MLSYFVMLKGDFLMSVGIKGCSVWVMHHPLLLYIVSCLGRREGGGGRTFIPLGLINREGEGVRVLSTSVWLNDVIMCTAECELNGERKMT